jgi:nuclear pore complex protein Nup62
MFNRRDAIHCDVGRMISMWQGLRLLGRQTWNGSLDVGRNLMLTTHPPRSRRCRRHYVCVWVSVCVCGWVWVWVCVGVYIYVCEWVCVYVYVWVSEWMSEWVSECVCVAVCVCVCVCVCVGVCVLSGDYKNIPAYTPLLNILRTKRLLRFTKINMDVGF